MFMKQCECDSCTDFKSKFDSTDTSAWINAPYDSEYGVIEKDIASQASAEDYPLYINDIVGAPTMMNNLDICASHYRNQVFGRVRDFSLQRNDASGLMDLHVQGEINDEGANLMEEGQMRAFSIAYYALTSRSTGEHVGNILDELSICVVPKIPGCVARIKNSEDVSPQHKNTVISSLSDEQMNEVSNKLKKISFNCDRFKKENDIAPVRKLVHSIPITSSYVHAITAPYKDAGKSRFVPLAFKATLKNNTNNWDISPSKQKKKKTESENIKNSSTSSAREPVYNDITTRNDTWVTKVNDIVSENQMVFDQLSVDGTHSERQHVGNQGSTRRNTVNNENSKGKSKTSSCKVQYSCVGVPKKHCNTITAPQLYESNRDRQLNNNHIYHYRILHQKYSNTSTMETQGTSQTATPAPVSKLSEIQPQQNAPSEKDVATNNNTSTSTATAPVKSDAMETEDVPFDKQAEAFFDELSPEQQRQYFVSKFKEEKELQLKQAAEKQEMMKKTYTNIKGTLSSSFLTPDSNPEDETYKSMLTGIEQVSEAIASNKGSWGAHMEEIISGYASAMNALAEENKQLKQTTNSSSNGGTKRKFEDSNSEKNKEVTQNPSVPSKAQRIAKDPFFQEIRSQFNGGGNDTTSKAKYRDIGIGNKETLGLFRTQQAVPVKNSFDSWGSTQKTMSEIVSQQKRNESAFSAIDFVTKNLMKGSELKNKHSQSGTTLEYLYTKKNW